MTKADQQIKLSSKIISQWSASLTSDLQEAFNGCTELAILKLSILAKFMRIPKVKFLSHRQFGVKSEVIKSEAQGCLKISKKKAKQYILFSSH